MASEIRVNKINNRAGLGTITIADTGVVVNGIVTCTEVSGLNVLNIAGVSTFASTLDINGDIDVDGHTNLDNVSIAGLSTHSEGIFVPDDKSIRIGNTFANPDLKIFSSPTYEQAVIDYTRSGIGRGLRIRSTNTQIENWNGLAPIAKFVGGVGVGHVELNYAGDKKFETTTKGIQVGTGVTIETNGQATYTGIVTASSFKLSDGSNVGGVESDGSQNTVGGSNAGDSIVSGGTENTVFGYNAGTAISNGDGNTFIGSRAGRSVTTGLTNTGVGYNVMGNASGTDNAALGSDAGNGMGDGRWHVAIGKGAFANTNQLGSQQNNIVIGYLADVSSSTVSNEMTLGNANINHVRIPGIGVSFSEGGAVISGVVTATSFSGDGSNLSNLPAGAPVGGASTNTVFFENDVAVAVNYQVTTNKNAMSAGPIAINAGIAVTVPSGSSWTIV